MIERICFLLGSIHYDTFRHFAHQLAAAFERQGVEMLLVEVHDKVLPAAAIRQIVAYRPTLTCSFNMVYPLQPHVFMCDQLGIPHWTLILDPISYYTHVTEARLALFSCVDRHECMALRALAPATFFLPHGIERQQLAEPWPLERCYAAVFVGSCYDYTSLRTQWQRELPLPQQRVLDQAAAIVLQLPRITLEQALVQAWRASSLDPAGVDFKKLLFYLDHYTRGRARIAIIKALKHVPIHIFGDVYPSHPCCVKGWQAYLGKQKNVTIHPPIPFPEVAQVLRQSKFCLNSMPFFKDGSHERVLMALAAGALPVTSPSLWLEEAFNVDQELMVYTPPSMAEIEEELLALLQAEDLRRARVIAGYDKVQAHHTWDQRAKTALETLPALLKQVYSLPVDFHLQT